MEKIFFNDNLFFLRNRIQVLRDLLGLEINSSIFNHYIMDEVRAIFYGLVEHEKLLDERVQIQGFKELAHQIYRIKYSFLQFLYDSLYSQREFLVKLLQSYLREWNEIIGELCGGNKKLIEKFYCVSSPKEEEQNHMVSQAELESLFQPPEDLHHS